MENVKNNKILPVAVATLAILLSGAAWSVSAQGPDPQAKRQDPTQRQEDRDVFKAAHQDVKAALEAGDYPAWKAAFSQLPNAEKHREKITEETFKKMAEAHQLMESGNREGAKAIMEELGIKPFHMKLRHGFHSKIINQLTEEQQKEMRETMEKKDPEAVRVLLEKYGVEMPESPEFAKLTEEQKAALKKARESGDREAVKAVMEKYGIEGPKFHPFFLGQGRGNKLTDAQKEELKKLHQAGDSEKMKALMNEYGFAKMGLKHKGFPPELKALTQEERQLLKDARKKGPEAMKEVMERLGLERPAQGGDFFFFEEKRSQE